MRTFERTIQTSDANTWTVEVTAEQSELVTVRTCYKSAELTTQEVVTLRAALMFAMEQALDNSREATREATQ